MNATPWPRHLSPFPSEGPWRGWAAKLLLAGFMAAMPGCGDTWMGSVGAVFAKDNKDGRVFVRELPPDMGAARAGLQLDDEVVAIDGKPVAPMTPKDVHSALAGPVGSKVKLRLYRGGEAMDVTVERGPLRPPQNVPVEKPLISDQ